MTKLTNNEFKPTPADEMRAELRMNCSTCRYMLANDVETAWCEKRKASAPKRAPLRYQLCSKYEAGPNSYDGKAYWHTSQNGPGPKWYPKLTTRVKTT